MRGLLSALLYMPLLAAAGPDAEPAQLPSSPPEEPAPEELSAEDLELLEHLDLLIDWEMLEWWLPGEEPPPSSGSLEEPP